MLLDATAGNRMLWKNKHPPLTIFMDSQIELRIPPDIFGAWEHLPFRDNAFSCVLFDPPHKFNRSSGKWMDPKGSYFGMEIRRQKLCSGIYKGTREFLRVANRLCFKWNDGEISLWRILSLFPKQWHEIFRRRDSKFRAHRNYTWWLTFISDS